MVSMSQENPSRNSKNTLRKHKSGKKRSPMAVWILLILIAVWMGLHFLPTKYERYRPIPDATALISLLIVPLVILFFVAVSHRSFWQSLVSLILIAINLVWSIGYVTPLPRQVSTIFSMPAQNSAVTPGQTAAQTAQTTQTASVTVMTLNGRYGRADASSIVHAVEQNHVDVLCMQEVTEDLVKRLDQDGLTARLPYSQLGESGENDNGGFNAIWTRQAPVESHPASLPIASSNVPTATIFVGNQPVLFASAHPMSPGRGGQAWQQSLSSLGAFGRLNNPLLANRTQVTSQVVMGDLNSNLHHTALRDVLKAGLTDSGYQLHKGMNLSFPASWPLFPALIEIDHVLYAGGIHATSLKTVATPHTDHKALIGTLALEV